MGSCGAPAGVRSWSGPDHRTGGGGRISNDAGADRNALVVADLVVVAAVALAAWVLADRTLRPIREAHARQRRFVADASHEIRTPLAAIRSSAGEPLPRDTIQSSSGTPFASMRARREAWPRSPTTCWYSLGPTSFPRIAGIRSTCRSSSPRRSRPSPSPIPSSRRSGCRSAPTSACRPTSRDQPDRREPSR